MDATTVHPVLHISFGKGSKSYNNPCSWPWNHSENTPRLAVQSSSALMPECFPPGWDGQGGVIWQKSTFSFPHRLDSFSFPQKTLAFSALLSSFYKRFEDMLTFDILNTHIPSSDILIPHPDLWYIFPYVIIDLAMSDTAHLKQRAMLSYSHAPQYTIQL